MMRIFKPCPSVRHIIALIAKTAFAFVGIYAFLSSIQLVQATDIVIEPKEPQWQLALDNQLLHANEAEISPHERGLARQLQILLADKNYPEVANELNKRTLTNDSAALLLLRGQVQLLLKDYQLAEQALLAALEKMPGLHKAHQGLSLLYMQRQDYHKAEIHLTKAIEFGVADAQIYGQLAYLHVKNNRPWAAIAGYRQALFLTPDNKHYQQGLLYALIESGDLSQAQALLQQQIHSEPGNSQLWLHRGQIALQQGQQRQALNCMEMALRLGADSPENLQLTAQMHLEQGSVNRALALIEQIFVASISEQQVAATLTVSTQALSWLIFKQQWPLAQTLYNSTESKLINKHNHLAKNLLAKWRVQGAQIALQQGNIEQAKAILSKAVLLEPSLGDALLALANIYLQQNQYQQAQMMYHRAQVLADYQESAWLGLAQLAIEQKHYGEALKLLRKTLQADPSRQDLVANIRSLERLVRHEG